MGRGSWELTQPLGEGKGGKSAPSRKGKSEGSTGMALDEQGSPPAAESEAGGWLLEAGVPPRHAMGAIKEKASK